MNQDSSLAYCSNEKERLARLRRLFKDRPQDEIFAVMEVPSRTLSQFSATHPEGYCNYPDPFIRIQFWNALLQERSLIFDDSVPFAYLSEMDQGLYGGMLGGKVHFMCDPHTGWISSMVPPILQDLSELGSLKFSRENEWFQRYLYQLEVFSKEAEGKFGISHFILINGLNFVFELVGATQTYLSLLEEPERIQQALSLAFELNLAVQNTFFEKVPLVKNGTCSNMAQWLPGRIISESVDPFHMTSVDTFLQWGREPLEKIFACFDGGVVHIHGNGRHLLKEVAKVKGLKAIYLGDDKGFPSAFQILNSLKSLVNDMPLVVRTEYEPFREALNRHRLIGGVLYQVSQVPNDDAANKWMEYVRKYRA